LKKALDEKRDLGAFSEVSKCKSHEYKDSKRMENFLWKY
jgi:hypothetical protein